jgi:hypothetical protein
MFREKFTIKELKYHHPFPSILDGLKELMEVEKWEKGNRQSG